MCQVFVVKMLEKASFDHSSQYLPWVLLPTNIVCQNSRGYNHASIAPTYIQSIVALIALNRNRFLQVFSFEHNATEVPKRRTQHLNSVIVAICYEDISVCIHGQIRRTVQLTRG